MNSIYEVEKDGYLVSTDASKISVDVVHQYLSQESYWAQNIPYETVQQSIENSLCFGLYHQQTQIGFARLITDKTTFAYLADVFVIQSHRGKGLSKFLMASIHAHPQLQKLRGWLLRTKDAHGLYEQFGWNKLNEDQLQRFMLRFNNDVYKKAE